MDPTDELAWHRVVRRVLDRSHLWRPDELAGTFAAYMAELGIEATIYLVDHEQLNLRPMAEGRSHRVDDSEPGRAFTQVRSIPGEDGPRWWVPMVNGTDRLGVIDFRLPAGLDPHSDSLRERCELVAGLIGHLITTTTPRGDHLELIRRSQPMTAAAELLWQVLQPLTVSCDRLTLSAILQPCYEVGGDGYDYAIDGPIARVGILDGVGKGMRAGLATAVALAEIRAARRAGLDLVAQARAADAALTEQFTDSRFVTAVLAELDLESGRLRYLNAGHPPPLVLRDGRIADELSKGRRLPLGLEETEAVLGELTLQQGDRLLLYSDGITEARDAEGTQFGRDRLAELIERHDAEGLPASETVRRLSQSVIEHQHGPPADDATLLLVDWSPSASRRTVPGGDS